MPPPQAAPLLTFMHTLLVVSQRRQGPVHQAGHAGMQAPFRQTMPPPHGAVLLLGAHCPLAGLQVWQGPQFLPAQRDWQAPPLQTPPEHELPSAITTQVPFDVHFLHVPQVLEEQAAVHEPARQTLPVPHVLPLLRTSQLPLPSQFPVRQVVAPHWFLAFCLGGCISQRPLRQR